MKIRGRKVCGCLCFQQLFCLLGASNAYLAVAEPENMQMPKVRHPGALGQGLYTLVGFHPTWCAAMSQLPSCVYYSACLISVTPVQRHIDKPNVGESIDRFKAHVHGLALSPQKPQKLRQMLEQHGELGRLYLAPEAPSLRAKRKKHKGNTGKNFTEGWVEFDDKRVAKQVDVEGESMP